MSKYAAKFMVIVGLALVSAAVVGCQSGANKTARASVGGDPTGTTIACPSPIDPETPFGKDSSLHPVYFDYDSSLLRADAVQTINENATAIRQLPNSSIQIEGHCDERGTQDYNFALGEMRALSVREHLIKLGIDGTRLMTISYGEEVPAATGRDESAWAQNRRCEFNKAM